MKRVFALTLFIITFLTGGLAAQNGGFAGVATQLGMSPRGMSMSNTFAATTSEGIYPYYNPALAAFKADSRQTDFTVAALDFDRVYQTAGIHFQLPPNAGIYFSLIRTGVTDIDERTLSGYPLGTFDAAEYQLGTSFGIRFNEKLNAGVGFKINYANYYEDLEAATAVGVDLGFLYHLSPRLNFGLTVQDMFANYTWNSGELYGNTQSRNVVNNFPVRYKLGFAFQEEVFTITAEFEIQSYTSEVNQTEVFIDNDGIASTIESLETINTSSGTFRLGGAWDAHERVTLRAGYEISDTSVSESNSFSGGFSVHLPFDIFSPSVDYAFVREPYGVANMHVFALRLHL